MLVFICALIGMFFLPKQVKAETNSIEKAETTTVRFEEYQPNGDSQSTAAEVEYTEADAAWSEFITSSGETFEFEDGKALVAGKRTTLPSRRIVDYPKTETWVLNIQGEYFTQSLGWTTTNADGVLVPFYSFCIATWENPEDKLCIEALVGSTRAHTVIWKNNVFVIPLGSPIKLGDHTYLRIQWTEEAGFIPFFSEGADIDLGTIRWNSGTLETVTSNVPIPYAAIAFDGASVFIGIQNNPY